MKCTNCGNPNLIVVDESSYQCPYCQSYVDRSTQKESDQPTLSPKTVSIDYSTFEQSIVNLRTDQGNGTGFIIHSKGWVLTNHHIVQDDIVLLGTVGQSNREYEFEVLATGQAKGVDIALLEILDVDHQAFPVISPAKTMPKIGDMAVTLGNPRNLGISLSKGSVSRISESTLQLDITVNPGNSGGPVLNDQGECIGIISYKQEGVEGYGFAIPLQQIKRFLNQFKAKEETL